MSDPSSPSVIDKIRQVARALTTPEFPDRMRSIGILEKLPDGLNHRAMYEARKVSTSQGARYEIYAISSVFRSKVRIKPTEGRLIRPDGSPLYTKEETLKKMEYLDAELAKKGRVEKDGDHMRHYHGRYRPRKP